MHNRIRLIATWTLVLGLWATVSAKIEESPLKAFFLEAVIRFVSWPADSSKNERYRSGEKFTIGIFENDELSPFLKKAFFKKKVKGADVRFMLVSQMPQIDSCDMLFIPESKKNQLAAIIEKTNHKPVLTVSDVPEFIEAGVILGIVLQEQKMSCLINKMVADSSRIRISYLLLQKSKVYPDGKK